MKKTLIALYVLLAGFLPAGCGVETPAQANEPPPGPALWKIEGGESPAWLFGSVHALRSRDLPLPERVMRAYEASGRVVMELDMDALDPAAMQQATLQLGVFADGKTLQEALAPELYARLKAASAELGLPLEALSRFEPWLVALTLQQARLQQLEFQARQGVETLITRRAQRDGKPIEGLESLEFQLGLFDGLPAGQQQAFLEGTLDELAGFEASLERIISAWRSGDLQALAEHAREGFAEEPALYERLVTARNRAWAERLDELLEESETGLFIVVGALHMAGKDSLVNMLEEKGYRVTRQ